MNTHVIVKAFDGCENLMAFVALVVFSGTVVQMNFFLVHHHVPIPTEAFGANVTVVVFDSRMRYHVTGKVTGCDESFIT